MAFAWLFLTFLAALVSPFLLLSVTAYDLSDALAGYNMHADSSVALGFHRNETEFSIMTDMLLVAGLAETEANEIENECTILAPSDESFYRTARDLGLNASSKIDLYRALLLFLSERYEDPIHTLRQQLLFHVLPNKLRIFPHDVPNSAEVEKLDAILRERGIYRMNMTLIDPNPALPDPNVIFDLSNVEVSNCYIHVIDRVLFFEPLVMNMAPHLSMEASMAPEPTAETIAESSYKPEPSFGMDTSADLEESSELLPIFESPTVSMTRTMLTSTKTPEPSSYFTPSLIDMGETASIAPLPSWSFANPSAFVIYTPAESSEVQNEEMHFHSSTPEASPFLEVGNEVSLSDSIENGDKPEIPRSPNPTSSVAPPPSINSTTVPAEEHSRPDLFITESVPEATLFPYINGQEISGSPIWLLDISPSPVFSYDALMEEDVVPAESEGPHLLPIEQLLVSSEGEADDFLEVNESEEIPLTPDADLPELEPTSESEDSECFPLSANFHLPSGEAVKFAQLDAGFDIMATESSISRVYLFTHRKTTGMHDFVQIRSNKNHSISLSQGHYIHANNDLKAAGHVRVGDALRTLDGSAVVTSVEWITDYGLVAPHTLHGDIVVNRVVVSTYTSAVNPKLAHTVLWPLRALVENGVAVEPMGCLLYNGLSGIIPGAYRFMRFLNTRAY